MKLYESLVNQTYKNFEWLIVDDGSTDDTQNIVNDWIKEGEIPIRYYKQENGGKHRAINKGLDVAQGELFFIVDSDDILPVNSLEIINNKVDAIFANNKIAGVVGRKAYFNGKKVGTTEFFEDKISNALDIRFKHHLKGDLAEVFKLDILKEYLFPSFEKERFCPEALVWNRIAEKYEMLYFDQIVYKCEYLEDGLTSKITKLRQQSPNSSMLYYSELEKYNIPLIQKIKANINFWRFSFASPNSIIQNLQRVSVILSIIGLPIGFVMAINDKRKI
ncbi:glycosyltransferase family A protein [Sphingobacterium sp. T2]|uniref:glycosyltransferase family A protein n=1 Tax=Sphingobacterium sp. T2 TaxID=1590596 RepID=UPI0018CE50F7|nr:glycosyltransferase family 2 protein [Sphingobacterium sp. T2]